MPSGGNFTSCNCGPDTTACTSPTEPVATVGLCLADGTPIAVTVVRDCAGTVTSEGWINLTTGAWSVGAPPPGTIACGDSRSIQVSGTFCDVDPATGDVLGLVLVEYSYAADGSIAGVRLVDAVTGQTYTPQGEVTTCPAGVEQPERDLLQFCDTAADGTVTAFVRDYARDENGTITGHSDYTLDGAPYTPAGTVGVCQPEPEPCRDAVTTLLCDVAALDTVTVLDPANVTGPDGWQITSFTDGGCGTLNPPDGPVPGPAVWSAPGYLGIRADRQLGIGCVVWTGYDTAPSIWVLTKTFTAPEDGTAVVTATGLTADGGVRVRVNGVDVGMYAQYNQPATGGSAQVPVTAGPNVIELEVRDIGGPNYVGGKLDVVMNRSEQFMRKTVTDCVTGAVISVTDTTLDGQPYTVSGTVGQCEPVAECCQQPPPETRVDVETDTLCLVSDASGTVLGRVLVERVYDDQSGDRVIQRVVDPVTGDPVTVPDGVSLAPCQAEPCRDTTSTLLCDTTALDALTVLDTVNRHDADGWTIISYTTGGCTGVNPPDGPVPGPPVWSGGAYLGVRADRLGGTPNCPNPSTGYVDWPIRWVLQKTFTAPEDGIAVVTASDFRADDGARVRINGIDAGLYGQWNQPATNGTVSIPVTAGPNVVEIEVRDGGGANWLRGRLDIVMTRTMQFVRRMVVDCETGETVSVTDTTLDGDPYTVTGEVGQCTPLADCCEQPPPELRVDIESDVMCIRDAAGKITGQVVVERIYDDQSGDRTEQRLTDPTTGDPVDLPDGAELVLCQEPACPVAFSTECVGAVTRTEAGYDNTSLINGVPGQCGSVQGPGGQFPCQPATGGYTIISWIVNGDEVIGEGGGRAFAGGPCGPGTTGNPGMHLNWSQALTNLDPSGATWSVQSAEGCAWFVGSTGGTQTVYGPMTVVDAAGQQWILGPAQACEEVQYTKVYSQECDGTVSVSWLDAQGVPTDAPEGDLGPCGTGCGAGGGSGLDVETLTLCDIAEDGTSVTFLRHITYGSAGQVAVVVDTALDGFTPYTPTGTVGVCAPAAEPCRNTTTLLVCDLPTDGDPAPTVTDTDPTPYYPYPTGVPVAGGQTLWDGGTLDLPPGTGPQPGTPGTVNSLAATIQAPRPACDTGTAHVTVTVNAQQTGPDDGCGSTGHLRLFNGTTQAALTVLPANTPAGYFGTLTVEADVPAAALAAGNIAVALALDAYDDSGGICAGARSTGWTLSAFTVTAVYDQTGCETQFLRTVTVDCETGAVVSVTDTTLDGAPYTATGEPGQCTAAGGACCPEQPCGDTEIAQLCDLTYDPQAPIPTPADDFTLTGNVVTANNGTTLWFAQANQVANGMAELIVSGLLPTVLYEFRFASAWIGAGAPDPANNNAIYRLDILDGTTVLATRTRNTSNGSNVFPGGVLSEDLPPLAFIAPATGAVTIRFTDQTTGGAINDRDLFLMPLEVRTAVLTVTRTPFLRAITFDCDGAPISSQDLALDGVTPYEVQGDAWTCAGEDSTGPAAAPGPDTELVQLCDVVADGMSTPFLRRFTFEPGQDAPTVTDTGLDGVTPYTPAGTVTMCGPETESCPAQNVLSACRYDDTDGDGIPDVTYVELLGVGCDGALTPIGTYTEDLSEPYTPISPVEPEDEGAPPATVVEPHRIELSAGESWDATTVTLLQSVTATAHGGTAMITTADGTSTLWDGESVTWSVIRDGDAALTGPLTVTAGPGVVTVAYTRTVAV